MNHISSSVSAISKEWLTIPIELWELISQEIPYSSALSAAFADKQAYSLFSSFILNNPERIAVELNLRDTYQKIQQIDSLELKKVQLEKAAQAVVKTFELCLNAQKRALDDLFVTQEKTAEYIEYKLLNLTQEENEKSPHLFRKVKNIFNLLREYPQIHSRMLSSAIQAGNVDIVQEVLSHQTSSMLLTVHLITTALRRLQGNALDSLDDFDTLKEFLSSPSEPCTCEAEKYETVNLLLNTYLFEEGEVSIKKLLEILGERNSPDVLQRIQLDRSSLVTIFLAIYNKNLKEPISFIELKDAILKGDAHPVKNFLSFCRDFQNYLSGAKVIAESISIYKEVLCFCYKISEELPTSLEMLSALCKEAGEQGLLENVISLVKLEKQNQLNLSNPFSNLQHRMRLQPPSGFSL